MKIRKLITSLTSLSGVILIILPFSYWLSREDEKKATMSTTFTFPKDTEESTELKEDTLILNILEIADSLTNKEVDLDNPQGVINKSPVKKQLWKTVEYKSSTLSNLKPIDTLDSLPTTLQAPSKTGYKFIGWYRQDELLSTEKTLTLQSNDVKDVIACFVPKSYLIAGIRKGHGTVKGSGFYGHGSTITLSAYPSRGYNFSGWFENGIKVSSDQEIDLIADRDYTLEAHFSDSKLKELCTEVKNHPKMFRSLGTDKKNLELNVNKLLMDVSLLFIEIETKNYSKETVDLTPAFFSYKMKNLKGKISIRTINPIYIHNYSGYLTGKSSQKTIYVFDLLSVPPEDIYIEQANICYKLKSKTINKVQSI